VQRILEELYPKRKCLQLEFPYVDVLKVQEQFGAGVVFLPLDGSGDLGEFEKLIKRRKFAGVYCELASNPLLRTVDILRLGEVLRKHDVPLIADDTVGTVHNIDAYRAADVVTTSLTKYYSGVGNLLAGSVTLRADSRFRKVFAQKLKEMDRCDLWDADAIILEQNSRDYARRMARLNENGEAIFEYLNAHPRVKQVWYPKNQTREIYDSIRREGGGYGALMSIVLNNAPRVTKKFYDALRVSKGPSLGTSYSLACPYTLLAHYGELDWAEECGVSRHLVRISVGLEDKKDLIRRFEKAFKVIERKRATAT
jgi:cystathionine gamma-synthase